MQSINSLKMAATLRRNYSICGKHTQTTLVRNATSRNCCVSMQLLASPSDHLFSKDDRIEAALFKRSSITVDRSGSPIPIEYLPAENTLSSKVRLMILYQNRPTTTIAVGDPLTLRIEAQDGYNQLTDIFATNVIARDPYSGRSIQLIDRYG